jgi:MFS family permease
MGAFAILSSTMSKNPALPLFTASLNVPGDLTGLIAAASTIPGILISLPAASLSDVFGRRKILLFSAFIFASAPFLYLFVTVWWQLALVRFYHGFATGIFVPVAEAAIAEQFPAKRGERISAFNSATYIGRGLAPFLGASIITITNPGSQVPHDFGPLYLAVGVAGVITLVVALLLLRDNKNKAGQVVAKPLNAENKTKFVLQGWVKVAKNKGALLVSFVQACQYYVYGAMEFYLIYYMTEVARFNALESGVVSGMQIVSLIIARPIMGRFSDKESRRVPIVLGCIISGGLVLLVPFTTQFPLLLIISMGYGLGFAMVLSSTAPLMCDVTPAILIGTSMGFLSTMMDVGQALGPIVSGTILGQGFAYNYVELFGSLTLLLAVSAVIFFFSGIARQRKTENPIGYNALPGS